VLWTPTYDQVPVPADTGGDAGNTCSTNAEAVVAGAMSGVPLFIELPTSVELTVRTPTRPEGDRSTGGRAGDLETGGARSGAPVRQYRQKVKGRHPGRALPRSRQ